MYAAVPVFEAHGIGGAVLLADLNGVARALADVWRSLRVAALAGGAAAVALGAGLASYMVRPLERLNRAVAAFSRGQLETRVAPGGSREIAALAGNFNTMAEELGRLDRQRKALVADASHELRTPVAAVRALTEGLLSSAGNLDRYREYLEDIVQECDRASRLVDRLLDLARLDCGRSGGLRSPVSPSIWPKRRARSFRPCAPWPASEP